ACLQFYQTSRVVYLILGAISAALLFATKETAFVSLGTLALAWLVSWWWTTGSLDWYKVRHSLFGFPVPGKKRREPDKRDHATKETLKTMLARFGGRDNVVMMAIYVLVVFIVINILFYSSFFTNWPGVKGAVDALKVWTNTGTSEFHGKKFDTYLTWLLQEEMPIFVLAIAGTLIALFEQKVNRFAIFVGAWSFGILVAYS